MRPNSPTTGWRPPGRRSESRGAGDKIKGGLSQEPHLSQRKALYTAEGRAFCTGNLHVPDDLEVIPLV